MGRDRDREAGSGWGKNCMISAQWVVSPPTGKAEIGRERKMSVSVAKSVAIVRSSSP